MFTEGTILYFKPFYFKNMNKAKNKYFVILKSDDNDTILASLPTSKDHVPATSVIEEGCINIESADINCFVISPQKPITTCGKCFPITTYIYGYQLETYSIETLRSLYPLEDVHYDVLGKMDHKIFNSLILCLKNSNVVKRKFRKMLR